MVTIHDDSTGSTEVSERVIALVASKALGGTGLAVKSVRLQGRTVTLKISRGDSVDPAEVKGLLDARLDMGFWIDLGLADYSPRFEF